MNIDRNKIFVVTFITIFVTSLSLHAQVFSGFSAFKELIEFEGQRYLMEEVYEITPSEFDKLKIDKTIKEVDVNEGFMFVLTSYLFNGKSGVIITSFNSTNFQQTNHYFRNVHLTNDEYIDLYNTFIFLEEQKPQLEEHILKKFNARLIVDVNAQYDDTYFTIWVDFKARHTFTKSKWDRALKRHKKFISK